MRSMFSAVAALAALVFGNAAVGVEFCSGPNYPLGPHHAHPECGENSIIRVFGASAVAVDGSPFGLSLLIRADTITGADGFKPIIIDAPGFNFGTIEFGPPSEGAFDASWPLVVQFLSPIGSAVVIHHSFFDISGTTMNVELVGNNPDPSHDVLGTVGNLAVTYTVNFRIGGDLGVLDEHPTGVTISGRVGSLHVAGDLMAQFVVLNEGEYAEDDSIDALIIEGNIGVLNPTNLTEEYAGRIATKNRIRNLTARNVYATIWPGEIDGRLQSIHRLRVVKDEFGGGDFFGALYADSIVPLSEGGEGPLSDAGHLWVEGDYGGTVLLIQPLALQESVFATPQIVVDGSMVEGVRYHSQILLPEDGLEGQIIVNRADDGGAWENCRVFVGDVELNTPNYATLPDAVGGGLIGEAPFGLHAAASHPLHNTVIPVNPCPWWEGDDCENGPVPTVCEPSLTVYLQHYGPITYEGNMPLKIETGPYRPSELEPEEWTDVSSDYYVTLDDGAAGGLYSRLKVTRTAGTGKWPMNMWYRFTPVPDVLKCLGVEGEPDVRPYVHRFAISWDCTGGILLQPFDLNNDNALNSGDIVAWVIEPTDLNEDDAADSSDLDLLIDVINTHGDD